MQVLTEQDVEQAVSEIDFGGLTEEQEAELERRIAAYRADPEGTTISLDEALSMVRAAIQRAHR
jgi:putative addiction module component (TIGR02574 family)